MALRSLLLISLYWICKLSAQLAPVQLDSLHFILNPNTINLYSVGDGKYETVRSYENPVELYWISKCNYSYFILTITPWQIYFADAHDNPTARLLYWKIDIDSIKYKQIKDDISQGMPKGFADLSERYGHPCYFDSAFNDTFSVSEDYSDSVFLSQLKSYCEAQITRQLSKFFAFLNAYVSRPIEFPDENKRKSILPKRFIEE